MKIDIITLSCAMNYGAVLQTYGLYAFMEDNGIIYPNIIILMP